MSEVKTLEGLMALARTHPYTPAELQLLERAFSIAEKFARGRTRYRMKNRPFLDHLINTSCLLIHSNLNMETVAAGLLHSVKPLDAVKELHETVHEIVSAYFDDSCPPVRKPDFCELTPIEWAVSCIQIANRADMILVGELGR